MHANLFSIYFIGYLMSFFLATPEEWLQYNQMKHTTLGLLGKKGFRPVKEDLSSGLEKKSRNDIMSIIFII